MKVKHIEVLVNEGKFGHSLAYQEIIAELLLAIESVEWHEAGRFIINPVRKGNGVLPIKKNFVETLRAKDWRTEVRMALVDGMSPGPIDAIKITSGGIFAVEWETGNISSSHRALNKIATGILQKQIIGGILVIPEWELSQYLTDRIGNYEEIAPYFPMYKSLKINDGVMGVISVTYDGKSMDAKLIAKGKDGNAKKVGEQDISSIGS